MRALVRLLTPISRLVDNASEKMGRGLAWLTLAVVVVGAFNAVARFLARWIRVDLSSNALIELQWYIFSVFFLLGGAYTLKEGGHVRVDVIYDRLRDRTRDWINFWGHLLLLMPFSVFMIWVSWPLVANSWREWEMSPDPGGLPLFPIKTVLPLAFVLLLIQGVSEVIKCSERLFGGAEESAGAAGKGEG